MGTWCSSWGTVWSYFQLLSGMFRLKDVRGWVMSFKILQRKMYLFNNLKLLNLSDVPSTLCANELSEEHFLTARSALRTRDFEPGL